MAKTCMMFKINWPERGTGLIVWSVRHFMDFSLTFNLGLKTQARGF